MDLTDDQWAILAPLLPAPRVRRDRRGRLWRDPRDVLNGILWVLRTGAPWKDLPARYPSYQTCHRLFQHWQRTGVYEAVLQRLAEDLRDRGQLDLTEGFIDASFSSAKKGAPPWALLDAVRAAKSWRSQTAMVFLSPCTLASASPHETKLVEPTLEQRFLRETPERMIGDRAYDSDPLDQRIQERYGVQLIAPSQICARRHRNTRRSPPASLSPPLEDRAPVRLAPQLPASREPL
jgi:transposase